jgi:hypothetical protein
MSSTGKPVGESEDVFPDPHSAPPILSKQALKRFNRFTAGLRASMGAL